MALDKIWLSLEIAEAGGVPITLKAEDVRAMLERIKQLEAENAALRQRVQELELQVALLTPAAYEYKIEGGQTTSPLGFTYDNRTYDDYDGEGIA